MKKLLCVFFCVMLAALSAVVFTGGKDTQKNYIKYVEFNVTKDALQNAVDLDIQTHDDDRHTDCITTLAYLGAKYGGDFTKYKYGDMTDFADKIKNGETVENLTKDMKYFNYYSQAYGAALSGIVGDYEKETSKGTEKDYGLCWFSPIAKSFPYSCYDDFGAVRTYGYTRPHLVMTLWRLSAHLLWRLSRERLKLWAGTGTAVGESESVLPTKNAIGTMHT